MTNKELLEDYLQNMEFNYELCYVFIREDEVTLDGQFTYEQVLDLAEKIKLIQEKKLELSRREVNE